MNASRFRQLALALVVTCAVGWTPTHAGQDPGSQQPPVVRTTTRLVMVNVVVHDKQGVPVKDLTRDNFTVLDGGQKQKISIFSVDSARSAHGPLQPLPPNTFSNHVTREGDAPTSVAVILLDALNTEFANRAWARQQVIKFLSQLQPRDRVALYVLGKQLHVVQDFTSDPSPLLEAVRHEAGTLGAAPSAGSLNEAAASPFPALSGPAAEIGTRLESGMDDGVHVGPILFWEMFTLEAIEAIANHLAGVPGRKSLIWVTGSVPCLCDPRVRERLVRTVHALDEADVALYPVDARGLFVDPDFNADVSVVPREVGQRPFRDPAAQLGRKSIERGRALSVMNSVTDAMIYWAQQTGGRAFVNTNDLKTSLRSALDDSELTYTLGYYPSDVRWDGRDRPIEVRVDRHGVEVRHRRSYLATPEPLPEDTETLLKKAAASPLDATTLGLTVTLEPLNNSGESKFQVTVSIDPKQVTFQPANGAKRVLLHLLAGQYSNQGDLLGGVQKTISGDLNEPGYAEMVRAGALKLTFDDNVLPGAADLRVVARDEPSGSIGSVKIPLAKILTNLPPAREAATLGTLAVGPAGNRIPVEPSPPLNTGTWRLAGRVTSPDNEPLAGARVQFKLPNRTNLAPEVETDLQGLFEIHAPAPSVDSVNGKLVEPQVVEVLVQAGKEGYRGAQEFVEIQAENSPPLGLVLEDDDRRATLMTPEALIAAVSRRLKHPEPNAPEESESYHRGVRELLQKRQTISAIPTLRGALALDPSSVECKFLLGLAYFDAGDWALAENYLADAAGLNTPDGTGDKLPGPLVALAVLSMWRGDWDSADRLLKKALMASPNDGLALQELGRLKMFRQDWDGAEETLQEAAHNGAPSDVHLLRARLDLDQGNVSRAQGEYQKYILTLPPGARPTLGETSARERRAVLSPAIMRIQGDLQDRLQLDSYGKTKAKVMQPLPKLLSVIPEIKGIQPAPSQDPLASLLHNMGTAIEKFMSEVPNTISDESIHQEKLSETGQVEGSRDQSYHYLVLVHAGHWPAVRLPEEYRTNRSGEQVVQYFENGFVATKGFALSLMIFHPAFQSGTDFRLLGRLSIRGHETQVVAFAQRPKESRFLMYYTSGKERFPFLCQGIAWVDIHSSQIVSLQTDLLRPLDQVGLKQATATVELARTNVVGAATTFWLPQKVTVLVRYKNQFCRNQHTYSNFRLFGVKSTIGAIQDKPQ